MRLKNKIIKSILKYSLLFSYGGMIYMCIELLARGTTHYSMSFCGGLSFILVGALNNIIPWTMPLILQCIISGFFIITPIEYLFGILFNRDYSIWCYLDMPLNINGHVCLPFTIVWCFIAVIAIVVDDWLRYWIFNEDKPVYKLF